MSNQACFEFGDYQLDAEERSLVRNGNESVPLPPKVFDLLVVLVRNSGHLLTRDELLQAVWPDCFVEENNLTVNISLLRKVLGNTDEGQAFIETVPKRGYRFRAAVVSGRGADRPSLLDSPGTTFQATLVSNSSPALQSVPLAAAPGSSRHAAWLPSRWLLLLPLLLILAVPGYVMLNRPGTRPFVAATTRGPRSLAVMPFRNLRQDPATDYLGFALADSLINQLAYVSEINVRPSSSVAGYATQPADPRRAAAELAVDTLLTGTYLKDGDKLRISSQLIEPATQRILWHNTVDVHFTDLLATSDSLARAVVEGMALHPTAPEAQHLLAAHPVDPQAYEEYLRGVVLYSTGNYRASIQVLEHAASIDGNFAPIWAALGRSYTTNASQQFGGEQSYDKALESYRKALALDPSLIACRVYMANLFTDTGRVEEAVPLLQQALSINRNYAEADWELSYAYRFGGLLQKSVELAERARRLDPGVKRNSSAINAFLYLEQYERFLDSLPPADNNAYLLFYRGFGEYYLHQEEKAGDDFSRAYAIDSSLLQARVGQAFALALRKDVPSGLALLRDTEHQVESTGVRDPEALYKVAEAYAALGDLPSALRVLEESVRNGFFPYPYIATDPLLKPVQNQQRFRAVLGQARERYENFRAKASPLTTPLRLPNVSP